MTSVDPKYFHGAYNLVLKSLLAVKPTARIALFTHYTDDGTITTGMYTKLNECITAIGKYWGVQVCPSNIKSGLINKTSYPINNLTIMSDSMHPASDPTGWVVNLLSNIAYDFLRTMS